MSKKTTESGFTLIEVIVTIAVVMILASATIAGVHSFAARYSPGEAARIVLGALEEAHARTLAADGDDSYGVYIETEQVTIFKGTSYLSGDPTNDVRLLPPRTQVSSISLGGSSHVMFERLSGNADTAGTITVSNMHDASASSTITVYRSGFSEISS